MNLVAQLASYAQVVQVSDNFRIFPRQKHANSSQLPQNLASLSSVKFIGAPSEISELRLNLPDLSGKIRNILGKLARGIRDNHVARAVWGGGNVHTRARTKPGGRAVQKAINRDRVRAFAAWRICNGLSVELRKSCCALDELGDTSKQRKFVSSTGRRWVPRTCRVGGQL